VLATGVL